MKILIGESGQHVIEAAKYYAQMGHEVVLALPDGGRMWPKCFYSRYLSSVIRYPGNSNDHSVISELKKIYESQKCDVFFPFGFKLVTRYLSVLADHPQCRMNTPYKDGRGYWKLSDKNELYSTISGTDVHIPAKSGVIVGGDTSCMEVTEFPVIIKRTQGVGIIDNVCLAWNQDDISSFIAKKSDIDGTSDEFILQEYIAGDAFDVGGFAIKGELYYAVPQRRTITLPLRGGVAAVNDIYPDNHLIDLASEVVKAAEWTGPFQAEFRMNPNDQQYYLIEVNAKMWGSTPLSLLSNSDILTIALDVAMNNRPTKSLNYKKDLRYRWVCSQEILTVSKGNGKDICQFFRRFFSKSHYDFSFCDPVPCLFHLAGSLCMIIMSSNSIPNPLISPEDHERLNS